MSYAPFDAGSAVEALFGPRVLPPVGHDQEHVEVTPEGKVKPGPGLTPGDAPIGGGMIGPGPAIADATGAAGAAINKAIVNPLLGVWDDFKAGLPVAGTFVALFVLFVVGLLMVFLGARGGESFVVQGGGVKNAGV